MLPRPRLLVLTIAFAAGCSSKRDAAPPAPVASSAPAAAAPARARRPAPVREGGALVRAVSDDALYLADEDRGVLRRIPIPVDVQNPPTEVKLPGAPANVLALDGRVLVTVRDPGLLLVFRAEGASLVEAARVPLPGDAWGLAITPDERTALVSSAWTHRISAVDLATSTKKWSLDVPREPRGLVVRPDGKSAYVTHLVGGAVTRIDQIDGAPAARPVDLHPAPASAPIKGKKSSFDLDATLAYAAVLSPAGDRLFVPRHALGAYGGTPWFGRAAVDVLLTADDTTLAPDRAAPGPSYTKQGDLPPDFQTQDSADGPVPITDPPAFVQPRAVAYRRATGTVLVAGEGSDSLAELDARSLDPALGTLRRYDLADRKKTAEGEPSRCGAPTGLALSADDGYAWVFCRSTVDLAIVKLDALDGKGIDSSIIPVVHLADDPLPEKAARGRRLFYTAVDGVVSGGIGCAGCHPDGRDDGHVWQEQLVEGEKAGKAPGILTAAPTRNGSIWAGEHGAVLHKGYPRQTPMLAGRVAARGPYGWYGRESILEQRLTVGFGQHGGGFWGVRATDQVGRAEAIAAFLRQGLVTPPRERRALTAIEQRGEEIFGSAETRCATCHFPGTDYTDRSVVSLGIPPWRPLFTTEARDQTYKTPSLLFVGGTPPYFHDGRAATLAELIDQNDDHMGRTRQLSRDDRAALAAFLATIGLVDASGEPEPVKAPTATDLTAGLAAPAPVTRERSEIPPPPAERSLAPTWPEWNNAPAVPLTRARKGCALYRVREWFRVHCAIAQIGQMILSTGLREGVTFAEGRFGEGGDLIFPARRGDRRVFEIDELAQRHKYSVSWGPAVVVTETWLPEDDAPTITVD